ncbi:MAG: hypothetical protein ACRCTW_06080 [Lactococcus garvieae]
MQKQTARGIKDSPLGAAQVMTADQKQEKLSVWIFSCLLIVRPLVLTVFEPYQQNDSNP